MRSRGEERSACWWHYVSSWPHNNAPLRETGPSLKSNAMKRSAWPVPEAEAERGVVMVATSRALLNKVWSANKLINSLFSAKKQAGVPARRININFIVCSSKPLNIKPIPAAHLAIAYRHRKISKTNLHHRNHQYRRLLTIIKALRAGGWLSRHLAWWMRNLYR